MTSPTPLKTVFDIFKAQVLACIIALVIAVLLFSKQESLSFFLGEIAMLGGNALLTFNVYRQNQRLAPLPLLLGFMTGEVGKYVVLVILTFIFAKFISLNWLAYAIGVVTPQLFGIIIYFLSLRFKKPR